MSDKTDKPVRIPGPDHLITITPHKGRVIVRAGGQVIADTKKALSLKEASYPAAIYIPREDADMALLSPTSHTTYCPYKGDCSYLSIPSAGARAVNAIWSYEKPYPAVAAIKDYLAFYPDRVDQIEELAV